VCSSDLPTSIAVRSGSRAAEPPVVLGDGVLEPARDLHRRLGAHRCAARVARCRAQLELGPLEEVDERSILALDQVGVAAAGQPAAQRLGQLANGPQLLLGQAVGPELIAQRQKVGAGRLQPLARLLEPLRILPEAVRIRPPDVAAIRIVEAAARAETAAIERTAGVQAALLRAALLGPALLLTALLLAALLLTAGLRILLLAFLRLAGLTLLLAGLPLSRLSGGAERLLARIEPAGLAAQLVQLAPQRLQLRDQLRVRIGRNLLALNGLLRRARERLLRLTLEVAQRRRRDRVRCRGLHPVAFSNELGRDRKAPNGLRLLQPAQRVGKLLGSARRLLAELLRNPLNVTLERLELLAQLVLAPAELGGFLTIHAAAKPTVDPVVEQVAHPLLKLGLQLALLAIQIRRPVREIGERLARRLLTLCRHLLQCRLELPP